MYGGGGHAQPVSWLWSDVHGGLQRRAAIWRLCPGQQVERASALAQVAHARLRPRAGETAALTELLGAAGARPRQELARGGGTGSAARRRLHALKEQRVAADVAARQLAAQRTL